MGIFTTEKHHNKGAVFFKCNVRGIGHKSKNKRMEQYQIKTCTTKDTISREKKQPIELEKMLAN